MKCRFCESEKLPFLVCFVHESDVPAPPPLACTDCIKKILQGEMGASDAATSPPWTSPKKKAKEGYRE